MSKYKSQMEYAKENLARIVLDVSKDTKEEFRKVCEANGVGMATVLKDCIQDYINNCK